MPFILFRPQCTEVRWCSVSGLVVTGWSQTWDEGRPSLKLIHSCRYRICYSVSEPQLAIDILQFAGWIIQARLECIICCLDTFKDEILQFMFCHLYFFIFCQFVFASLPDFLWEKDTINLFWEQLKRAFVKLWHIKSFVDELWGVLFLIQTTRRYFDFTLFQDKDTL